MNNRSAALLNDLLEVVRDGERFYRDAAERAGSPELRGTFRQMAELRQRLMDELAEHVTARGEEPSESRTLAGRSRQLYAGTLTALGASADAVYLRHVEAAEDRLLAQYERALEVAAGDRIEPILRRHLLAVRAAHDRMKALRDQSLAA